MGHAIVNGAVVPTQPTNQDTMGAAGAATSTAADMARYLQMYLNNGRYGNTVVLKPESVSEIYKRSMVAEIEFTELPPISERTGFYYGLGFDSFDYGGYHVIEKAGALAGVRTLMTMIPEKHVGIVVLANLNITAFPEALRTYYIESIVLHRSPDTDLKEIWARNQKLASMLDPPKPPQNPLAFAGSLSGLAGTYENQLYGRCTISQAGKALEMACGPAKYSAPLVHWNGGQFIAKWPGATSAGDDITFTIGSDGKAASFNDDPMGLFTRVKP